MYTDNTVKASQVSEFFLLSIVLVLFPAEPSETYQDSNLLMLRETQLNDVNCDRQTIGHD